MKTKDCLISADWFVNANASKLQNRVAVGDGGGAAVGGNI